jgi:hypothetical protein
MLTLVRTLEAGVIMVSPIAWRVTVAVCCLAAVAEVALAVASSTLVLGVFVLGLWVGARRPRAPAARTEWADGTAPQ